MKLWSVADRFRGEFELLQKESYPQENFHTYDRRAISQNQRMDEALESMTTCFKMQEISD
jgi:hypothetical protein